MQKIKLPAHVLKTLSEVKPYEKYMIEKLRLDGYTPQSGLPNLVTQFYNIYGGEFETLLKGNPDAGFFKDAFKKIKKGANAIGGVYKSVFGKVGDGVRGVINKVTSGEGMQNLLGGVNQNPNSSNIQPQENKNTQYLLLAGVGVAAYFLLKK